MITEADKIKNDYFRLRAKAVVALAEKFGKRRSEIACLARKDLKVEDRLLYVTFTLSKKHKRGFFQFLKVLEKTNPAALDKPLGMLKLEWKAWTQTEEGHSVRQDLRTKSIDRSDRFARLIIEYMNYMDAKYPHAKFLFPAGMTIFGQTYKIFENEHLSGRQMLRLIKLLNPSAWMHLFRETKGGTIAKAEGRTLKAVYDVKETLDLENEETAYRYVRRYAVQEMEAET